MILSKLIFATSYAKFIYIDYTIKCGFFPVFMHLLAGQPHEKISDICAKLPVFLLMI